MTKQDRLDALRDFDAKVTEARLILINARITDYGDGSPVMKALADVNNATDDLLNAANRLPDWSNGTQESWWVHGTVIVANPADPTQYALDPDFQVKGTHYIWVDGHTYFAGQERKGGWSLVR